MEKTKKDGFNSGIGFVLAAAGSSVGLGNLWSFPYKTSQNGGAAFVIVYVLSVILLGTILCVAEMYIGRRAKSNPVTAFKKIHKRLGFVGIFGILGTLLITFFYSVLGGYTLKFTVNSFSDNTEILQSFSANWWEVILFTALFLLLSMVIIFLGVKKGIEKASLILMPILVVVLVGIAIYCLCLGNGVSEGLNYYLNPDFRQLGFKGVLAAMSQAFFSLSVGTGIMAVYGSYTGEKVKIGRSVLWIAFFDTFVALIAGLAIFPAIYHYQAETGVALQNNGLMLLFSSMPIIFNKLGFAGKIISFFFFGMVSIAAITSVIALLEGIVQLVVQVFKVKKIKAIPIVTLLCLIGSIPVGISLGQSLNGNSFMSLGNKNLLEILDSIVSLFFIPIGSMFIAIALGWLLFKPKNKKELFSVTALSRALKEDGLNLGKFQHAFSFGIKFVAPIAILLIEIMGIVDAVWPDNGYSRVFSSEGLILVIISFVLGLLACLVYFFFLQNRDTGVNEGEEEEVAPAVEEPKQ